MINKLLLAITVLLGTHLFFSQKKSEYVLKEKAKVEKVLDDLNKFAAEAKFEQYFSLYSDQSIFVGTDAMEVWDKKQFMAFAKPFFDKGKAWDFKSIRRNVYFSRDGKTAWFDEELDTWMKICRGSGVLEKEGNYWKIKQYVLSMTIPNDATTEVLKIKGPMEEAVLNKYKADKN